MQLVRKVGESGCAKNNDVCVFPPPFLFGALLQELPFCLVAGHLCVPDCVLFCALAD